jgi:hypothetical protein
MIVRRQVRAGADFIKLYENLSGLAAAALLAATCLAFVSFARARQNLASRHEETARGLLLQSASDATAAKQALRRLRWSAAVLGAATLGIWLLRSLGRVSSGHAVKLSLAWGATALAILAWAAWRERRLEAERQVCDRLLQELDSDEEV